MSEPPALPLQADQLLEKTREGERLVVFLTGAGISAESGVPTFRGEEGYWTIGSDNYTPTDLATSESFHRNRRLVWSWYLYRLGVCRAAEPNPAHLALAHLEDRIGDRFLLITQNVDGLHRRAGNTPERTYEIHGNIESMRCAIECTPRLLPLPDRVDPIDKDTLIAEEMLDLLRCPECGSPSRPHVLWFDEFYDEEHYYRNSTQMALRHADLLVIVGSSGATNLPLRLAELASRYGVPIIDVNVDDDDFPYLISRPETWIDVRQPAGSAIPAIVDALA